MAAQSAADCTPSTVTAPHVPSLASAVSTDFWFGPWGQVVALLLGCALGLVLGCADGCADGCVLGLGSGWVLGDAAPVASATGDSDGSPDACWFAAGWQAARAPIRTAPSSAAYRF